MLYPRNYSPSGWANKLAQRLISEPIPQLLSESTLTVSPKHLARKGSGTAFFIKTASNGQAFLLTNAHVVRGCVELIIEQKDLGAFVAEVKHSASADLALISIQSNGAKKEASLLSLARARKGEQVSVYGYPLDGLLASDGIVSEGIVNSVGRIDAENTFFQMSAPIQQGNSGSSIVNTYGDLVGVATAKLNALSFAKGLGDLPQNVNFGVTIEQVALFLDSVGFSFSVRDRSSSFFDFLFVPSKESLIERIDSLTVRLVCYANP